MPIDCVYYYFKEMDDCDGYVIIEHFTEPNRKEMLFLNDFFVIIQINSALMRLCT